MLSTNWNMIGATSLKPNEPMIKHGVARIPMLILCSILVLLDIKKRNLIHLNFQVFIFSLVTMETGALKMSRMM